MAGWCTQGAGPRFHTEAPSVRVHGTARSKPAARIPRWYWSRSGERCVFLNPAVLAPTLRYSTARQSTALLLGHYLHYSMAVDALLRCALQRACLYVMCTSFGNRRNRRTGTKRRVRDNIAFLRLTSDRWLCRRVGVLYIVGIIGEIRLPFFNWNFFSERVWFYIVAIVSCEKRRDRVSENWTMWSRMYSWNLSMSVIILCSIFLERIYSWICSIRYLVRLSLT